MKGKPKKVFSNLLAVILAFGLFAAVPLKVFAAPPAAPSDLTLTAHMGGVTLQWKDNSNNETGFSLERKEGSGAFVHWGDVPANTVTRTDTLVDAGKKYTYRVRAYASGEFSAWSDEVVVTIPAAPVITSHPQNKNVSEGQGAEFKVVAFGFWMEYQWQFLDGSTWKVVPNYPPHSTGEQSDTLKMANLDSTYDNMTFRCAVSNAGGTVYSNQAKLTVASDAPVITSHPQNKSVAEGQSAEFKVVATGSAPLTYQWQYYENSTWKVVPNYPPYSTGEDTPTLKMSELDSAYNNMIFRCAVTNVGGTVYSNQATLSVTSASSAYTVTFDTGGGSAVASQSIVSGAKAVKPADPTKAGGSFAGWYKDAALATEYDFNDPVTANITLYAKWTAIGSFTVTFDSNGGSAVANQTVVSGDKAVKPADPTKAGDNFAGWYKEAAITTEYDFNDPVTANITLYAKWIAEGSYAVTFDSNGGSAVASQIIVSGEKAVKPADPTKAGNVFAGWHKDAALAAAYDFDEPVTANLTLYAKWAGEGSFTVTFVTNGGSAVAVQTVSSGEKANQPAIPTKAGATFAGWFTDEALTSLYNFDNPVTANITLYAKWTGTGAGAGAGASASASAAKKVILMKIGDPYMYVDDVKQEIDPGRGTVPLIVNSRTILPIRAIVEAMDGTVGWDAATRTITLAANGHTVTMWLDKTNLVVDGNNLTMDVAPVSINDRTMVPVRFAAENLGYDVTWIDASKEVIISYK